MAGSNLTLERKREQYDDDNGDKIGLFGLQVVTAVCMNWCYAMYMETTYLVA